jgi:hypothetical protein
MLKNNYGGIGMKTYKEKPAWKLAGKLTCLLQNKHYNEWAFASRVGDDFVNDTGMGRFMMCDWQLIEETHYAECAKIASANESIDNVLAERGKRYGAFKDGASIMQQLKTVIRSADGWERLTDSQKEALEMIQHKIGRVLNGDPTYVDSWTDICGFSQLIVSELEGDIR